MNVRNALQASRADDDAGSVASGRTASGARRSGRRVTFSPDKEEPPQEDNFLQACAAAFHNFAFLLHGATDVQTR